MLHKNFIAAVITLIICSGCANNKQVAAENRDMNAIFTEAIEAATDTTSAYSDAKVKDLMNELADTLLSVMVNSPVDEVRERIIAQDMAGTALATVALCGIDEPGFLESVSQKYRKVQSTWRTQDSPEHGFGYVKELPFLTQKGTDDEMLDAIFIITRITINPRTALRLPREATKGVQVIFANRSDSEETLFDIDNSTSMGSEEFQQSDYSSDYIFEGTAFMEEMMSHDAMFIMYTAEYGSIESAMIALDGLHELVEGSEQD